MRLVISRAARADLKSIARYSEREWSSTQAKVYMAALAQRFRTLLRLPRLGAPRGDIAADYRSLSSGRHVIFYRLAGEELVIVRVLHQSMDAKLHL